MPGAQNEPAQISKRSLLHGVLLGVIVGRGGVLVEVGVGVIGNAVHSTSPGHRVGVAVAVRVSVTVRVGVGVRVGRRVCVGVAVHVTPPAQLVGTR